MAKEIRFPGDRAQALVFPDHRFSADGLRPSDKTLPGSDYTELGLRPSTPIPREGTAMVLKAGGSPSDPAGFAIQVQTAGHPLPDAASFLAGVPKIGPDLFGHDGPQVLTGVEALVWSNIGVGGRTQRPSMIRLQSGVILIVEHSKTGTGTLIAAWHYDPKLAVQAVNGITQIADANVPLITGGQGIDAAGLEVVQLPSGRVLCFYCDLHGQQVHALFSDDDGVTWALYSKDVLPHPVGATNVFINDIEVSFLAGTMVMFLTMGRQPAVPSGALQFVSYDLGGTFGAVGGDWFTNTPTQERIRHAHLEPLPTGQHVLLYWMDDGVDSGYYVRVIDPGQPGYDTTPVLLVDAAGGAPDIAHDDDPSCALWTDEDGVLYAMMEAGGAGLAGDQATVLMRSLDGGGSWFKFKTGVLHNVVAADPKRPHLYSAMSIGGRVVWVSRFISAAAPPHPSALVAMFLGGHATATVGALLGTAAPAFNMIDFVGWGADPVGGRLAGVWYPAAIPSSMGWTLVAGGGTDNWSTGGFAERTVDSNANTRWWYWQDAANKPTTRAAFAIFNGRVTAGGSLASGVCGFTIRLSDYDQPGAVNATAIHEIQVNATTTAFRVYDGVSGLQIGGDQAWDMTLPTQFLVMIGGEGVGSTQGGAIFYGRPGQAFRDLTLHSSPGALADDSGANPTDPCRVEFGNMAAAAGANTSHWSLVGFNFGGTQTQPDLPANFFDAWSSPKMLRGRDFATLPAHVYDDWRVSASRGPARSGEVFDLTPRSDYSVRNIFPLDVASPRNPWRSAGDGTLMRIAVDFDPSGSQTEAFMGNSVLGLGAFNCNLESLNLLGWNVGGGVWDTVASLTSIQGFDPLAWLRAGFEVRPDDSQANVGEHYIWRSEHIGDTFNLGVGEDALKRIVGNTEGAWRVDGSGVAKVKQPTLFLEGHGFVGGEAGSGGAGSIRVRNFAGVVREYAGKYQRWALEIPAQKTVDGYYQIGSVVFGDALVLGQQYDLGWRVVRERRLTEQERRDGSRAFRRDGPQRREIQLAWVETALQVAQEQAANPDPNYRALGTAAGFPVASRGDVLRAVEGALEASDGPAVPVMFIGRVERRGGGAGATQEVTRRRQFGLYRIETDPVTENLAARQGEMVDEVERLNTLTLREVP